MVRTSVTVAVLALLILALSACGGPTRFVDPEADLPFYERVAIVPFVSLSQDRVAGLRVSNVFFTEVLRLGFAEVLEPGQFAAAMKKVRGGTPESTPLSTMELQRIGQEAGVQAFFLGTVREYEMSRIGRGQFPLVSIEARLVDAQTGRLVWSATQTRKGGPGFPLFGWGEVHTLGELTAEVCRDLLETLPVTARLLPVLGLLALAGCGVPAPHAYVAEPLQGAWRIAILPLANYSEDRDAPDRLAPILAVEVIRHRHVAVVDAGEVEQALSREPWLLADRVPPDLLASLAKDMNADALLLGSILAHGYREDDGNRIPYVSISLRLLQAVDGRVLWSANHSRDGADGETVFGFGRVMNLEQLVEQAVEEIMATMPPVVFAEGEIIRRGAGEE